MGYTCHFCASSSQNERPCVLMEDLGANMIKFVLFGSEGYVPELLYLFSRQLQDIGFYRLTHSTVLQTVVN